MAEHLRHKEFTSLDRPRELVLVCPGFKSNVNLSRIIRLAGCAGLNRVVACGNSKIDPAIARGAEQHLAIEQRRTMVPVLKNLKRDGFQMVGLEQTDESQSLFDFQFERSTALVVGHERLGMEQQALDLMDELIEIPVYGLPYSYNVVTATTMAVYEYCRQFPDG